MKLQNRHTHMRGKNVLCNGTRYGVDADGMINASSADAKRLLAGQDWTVISGKKAKDKAEKPVEPDQVPQAAEPEPKEPDSPTAPPEAPKATTEVAEPEMDGDADDGEQDSEGEVAKQDEYPDPDMSMTKARLQESADAYEIKYDDKITKAELVDLISSKMYPDG